MRVLWAVFALFLTFVVTVVLLVCPFPTIASARDSGATTSLGRLILLFGPSLFLAVVPSLLLAFAAHGRGWRSAAGLGTATRASIGLGLFAFCAVLARTLGAVADTSATARPAPPLWLFFVSPLVAVAVGALLFDSLRVRAARREGRVPGAAYGGGLLLALVALSGVAMLLSLARF